ncbi:MAG TPA: pyruvate dehydrogenase complex E1 component subunit beta [Aliiroseovarius sp.]|nr:pyruvate dehydrogenase complex E1 component subunit beta [Aliiroseovarius sp.]
MATEILMPALSPTMEEGKLAKWLVKEGDSVAAGDVIAEIETDKAVMEFEAVDEGVIGRILVPEGAEAVAVNTPIAVLLEDGEKLGDTPEAPKAAASSARSGDVGAAAPAPAPEAPAPAAPVAARIPDDPEIPPGTAMKMTTVREALRDAMAEEMRRNDDVFLMGEEVAEYQGAYKVSQGLLEEFSARRVIDTPITEMGFTGLGVGAAFAGLRPIVEFMTFNFAMQAIDHIINSAAKTRYMSGGLMTCPIVFRGANGAAARVAAQHSQDYAAWYAHVPGLWVAQPYSAADAKGLLKTAIRSDNPVVFLENELMYGEAFEVPQLDDYTIPFGRARIWREGTDVTLVSFGIGMKWALAAADALAGEGISAEVIDLRTLRPMDTETVVKSVMKTNRCVTVEEGWPVASIGNHISAVLMQEAFDWLDAPVLNVTGRDVPMPYAANLEKLALVTVDDVVSAVKSVTYRQE